MKYPLISRFHLSFYYWLFPFLSQPSFELVCYITAIKPCGKLLWKYKPRTFYENWINVYILLNKANLRWSSSGELFKYYTGNQMYINLYLFISHTNPKCNFMYILPSVIRKSQVCKNIREWTEEKKNKQNVSQVCWTACLQIWTLVASATCHIFPGVHLSVPSAGFCRSLIKEDTV